MYRKTLLFIIATSLLATACEENSYTPKPRGFPKVDFPNKEYQPFDKNFCEFSFEYPKYAEIIQDTSFFDEKPADECWFDIYIPKYDARIHCSYYPIDKVNTFEKMRSDAFTLASKHNVKADYIDEIRIQKPNKVSGFLFDIQGAAASPFQFYLSDSTKHFMRGALYVKAAARPDSLQPIFEFIKTDIVHMINTFEWNK